MNSINRVDEEGEQKVDVTTSGPTEEMQKQSKTNEQNLVLTLAERGTEDIGNIHKYS